MGDPLRMEVVEGKSHLVQNQLALGKGNHLTLLCVALPQIKDAAKGSQWHYNADRVSLLYQLIELNYVSVRVLQGCEEGEFVF